MEFFDSLSDKLKDRLRSYVGPPKNLSLSERAKQKSEFERVAVLLGLNPVKSRKLSLEFGKKKSGLMNFNNYDLSTVINSVDSFVDYDDEDSDDNDGFAQRKDEGGFSFSCKEDVGLVSFEDVVSYFKGRGVVGEESLCLKIFLAASNNMSFGVEGYSGSGKTFVVDKLIDLFDDKDLYRLDLSSKMAVFYDSKNINSFKTIYIPELQKALQETRSPIVEIVKNLTEGKDVKRIVTDDKKKGNKTFKINKGKSVIYTLASENYFKKDEELNRRFLRFKTDSCKEHLEEILNFKSLKRQDFSFDVDVDSLKYKLQGHLGYLRNLDVKVFDPFSSYLSSFLPRTQKSVGYVDHYFSLVDAATRFNYNDRFCLSNANNNVVVADLEDHFVVHKLYHSEFLDTLKGFSERNKFDEELSVIGDLKSKSVDWDYALRDGLGVVKKQMSNNFEKYISRFDNNYVDDMMKKYDFIKA
jgi:hypothetical protein